MSDDISDVSGSDRAEEIKRWLTIGNAIGLGVLLLVTLVLIAVVSSTSDDVATLREQVKKSNKAGKAMQEELAAIKEQLQAPPAREAPSAAAAAQPTNIDAADPAHDCVVRPGDKDGLANCLKQGPKGR